jgi:hypothetical protein
VWADVQVENLMREVAELAGDRNCFVEAVASMPILNPSVESGAIQGVPASQLRDASRLTGVARRPHGASRAHSIAHRIVHAQDSFDPTRLRCNDFDGDLDCLKCRRAAYIAVIPVVDPWPHASPWEQRSRMFLLDTLLDAAPEHQILPADSCHVRNNARGSSAR